MTERWPDLAVLELLVAVSETRSLGAGARRVGMAQPNASRAMAKLERSTGLSLLERSPRGTRTTTDGELVVDWAREVLRSAVNFSEGTTSLRSGIPTAMDVAASMTVAEYLMPAWLATFRNRHPDLQVNLQVMNSALVLDQVQSGAVPLGFIETPHVPAGINSLVVTHDRMVVVVPPGHPWTLAGKGLTLEELARTPLVVRESGSGTREALEEILAGWDMSAPAQVLGSNAAVRISVSAGAGPAVLSELAAAPGIQSGELRQVDVVGLGGPRPLTAVWTGPRRLAGPAAQLIDVVMQP